MLSLHQFAALFAVLLAAAAVRAQAPTLVTTLPRPKELAPAAQLPDEPPAPAPAIFDTAPPLPPIGALTGEMPGVIIPPDAPFYRRIRADLLELAVMFPTINQNLNAVVDVGGVPTNATLPTASLGFTAPVLLNAQIHAWRYGVINVGYRMLVAEGSEVLGGFDPGGPANLRSRLDMNTVDVTFTSSGYGPLWNLLWFVNNDPIRPLWGLRWDVGGRFTTFFFDSTAAGPTVTRHVSSHFIGGGPHVGLRLHRLLGDSGVALFSRADFGINMGSVRQQFSEESGGAFGYAARSATRAVPTLIASAGLGADPPLTRLGRWEVGYQFEQWWGIGDTDGSRLDLLSHGVMLRWLYNY